MMQTLMVYNEKGGVGKTTLSAQLERMEKWHGSK